MNYDDFSIDEIREMLKKNAVLLGSGAGRDVYDIGQDYVIKIATNPQGLKQNKKEAAIALNLNFRVPKLRERAKNFDWIAVDKVSSVSPKKFEGLIKKLTGLTGNYTKIDAHADLMLVMYAGLGGNAVSSSMPARSYVPKKELLARHNSLMNASEWYKALFNMVLEHGIDPGEIGPENFGIDSNDYMVMLDTGT